MNSNFLLRYKLVPNQIVKIKILKFVLKLKNKQKVFAKFEKNGSSKIVRKFEPVSAKKKRQKFVKNLFFCFEFFIVFCPTNAKKICFFVLIWFFDHFLPDKHPDWLSLIMFWAPLFATAIMVAGRPPVTGSGKTLSSMTRSLSTPRTLRRKIFANF